MINVFFTKTSKPLEKSTFDALLLQLPLTMQGEILKYKNWEDRQRSLLGKALLKQALKDLDCDGYMISELKFTSFNKPYFDDKIDFNISHSGEYVLCAISTTCKLGVDIEEVKEVPFGDFTTNFSVSEWNEIYNDPDPLKSFYRFWTQKEAFLKAIGMGLNVPLYDVSFVYKKIVWAAKEWFVQELSIDEHYATHLCSDVYAPTIIMKKIAFD